jgi:RNA polymerase sigma-70 factor (ECF subfamily)
VPKPTAHPPNLSASEPAAAPDDLRLIGRVAQRDQNALLELYTRYGNAVYALALRVLQQGALAEEVTQDVFLKLWQQPERWNPGLGRFSSWLLTLARNAAIDRLRHEQRRGYRPAGYGSYSGYGDDPPENVAAEPSPFSDPLWYDGQVLRRLLARLPAEQRDLVELAFFRGYTHSELAELLHLPLGTVKTRLRAGLQKLRALWLAEEG